MLTSKRGLSLKMLISLSSILRPSLRRLIYVNVVILVVWISTHRTNFHFEHQPQQQLQPKQLKDNATLTGTLYSHGFSYSNSKLCPGNGENVSLIILITSPPLFTHEENRMIIRNTWRHLTLSPKRGTQAIVMGFMIGIEGLEKSEDNKLVNYTINQEMSIFDDIIIGNNVDSYENLTLKTLSILEWAITYCSQAKYLLKTDDDNWINIPKLINFTRSLDNGRDNNLTIYGALRSGEPPHRHNKSKYFISFDQYPELHFPAYVAGPAYLLPRNTWQNLYLEGLQTKFLKLEDVYFTGIVADKLRIPRVNVTNFLLNFDDKWRWNDTRINDKVASTVAVSFGLANITDINHIWNAYSSSGCYIRYGESGNCKSALFAKSLYRDNSLKKENSVVLSV